MSRYELSKPEREQVEKALLLLHYIAHANQNPRESSEAIDLCERFRRAFTVYIETEE